MDKNLDILLVSEDETITNQLLNSLERGETSLTVVRSDDVTREVNRQTRDIVIFVQSNNDDTIELIQYIKSVNVSTLIIFLATESDINVLRSVTRGGAEEFFILPEELTLFLSRFPTIQKNYQIKRNSESEKVVTPIVNSKLNILISGGAGSGKTTILNVLATFIPHGERVITIEDSAELKLVRPNVVGMEARPANVEGKGEVTIRNLVKNALRMRPDRIIVGEVRSGEAFDMLQAMNTGHEGSITTVHANSPDDALRRVEAMVVMSGMDLPSHIIREYIVGALDIIIQATRLTDGTRKIISISEMKKNEDGSHDIREIYTFKRTGITRDGNVEGYYTATGYIPQCLERLRVFGNNIPESLFHPVYEEVKL